MFYTELINYLRSSAELSNYISVKNNLPSVFSNFSPEGAELPYIVINIKANNTVGNVITQNDIEIDYYDFNKSKVNAEKVERIIVNLLDQMRMDTDAYKSLRFSYLSSGFIEDSDPRDIHLNLTFSARGSRSKWMVQTY